MIDRLKPTLALAALLLLAACGPAAEEPAVEAPPGAEVADVADAGSGAAEESAGAVANSDVAEDEPAGDTDDEAADDAAEAAAGAMATPRTARIATDPATVELVAGRPQLVEFFAYW